MAKSMLLFGVLAGASAAAAFSNCPPHSTLARPPYTDMRSCDCEDGWEAYPFPSWGCYHVTPEVTCPAHSSAPGGTVTSLTECQCEEGWAPYRTADDQFTCVYAYVFHVHGRLWLQPFNKTDFNYEEEVDFQQAMGQVLGVLPADILPYSVNSVEDVQKSLDDARLGYAKVLLAENEHGELSKAEGTSIGFAVRIRGDKMEDGHDLVSLMKDPANMQNMMQDWKNAVQEPAFADIDFTSMFVWALTAEFWKPTCSLSQGDECEHDFECCAVAEPNGIDTVKLTCAHDKSSGTKQCRYPFTWAPPSPTPPPTPVPPTASPTPLAPGLFYRAVVHVTLDLQCECANVDFDSMSKSTCLAQNGLLSYTDFHAGHRATLLESMGQALAVAPEHLFIASVLPSHLSEAQFTEEWTQHHVLKRGVTVKLGFNAFTMDEVHSTMDKINDQEQLSEDLAEYATAAGWSLTPGCIGVDDLDVVAESATDATEQVAPTPAPTLATIPGSMDWCGSGQLIQSTFSLVFTGDDEVGEGSHDWLDGTPGQTGFRDCFVSILTSTPGFDIPALQSHDGSCVSYAHTSAYAEVPLQDSLTGVVSYKQTMSLVANLPTTDMLDTHFLNNMTTSTTDFGDADSTHLLTSTVIQALNEQCVSPSALTGGELQYLDLVQGEEAPTPAPIDDVDCETSAEWTEWTECSHTCGDDGEKSRFRVIVTDGLGNGARCQLHCPDNGLTADGHSCVHLHETDECNRGVCPTDCEVSDWGHWDTCDQTCGVGQVSRSRSIIQLEENDGLECPTLLTDTDSCSLQEFCPVDCTLSDWAGWSDCSKECDDGEGPGERVRRKFVENTEYYGGEACEPDDMIDTQSCNENLCPVDCVVSAWSAYGSCSKTCAGKAPGTRLFGARQERTRYIITDEQNGGRECPKLFQTKLCALHPCGAHVCTTNKGFPLTCTYERGIVYTHHVNDVHDDELFMCYHNYVTEVCTCLCWPKNVISSAQHSGASDITSFHVPSV